ncbi:ZN284 protein, partial [Semnornis frantzii]|nr:ZN284 protein [Semnornis frantzii]
SFTSSCALRSHSHLHTGEKPYSCGDCGKSFAARSSLWYQCAIHTWEKLHLCSACGK